jgi:hypothetical protein
MKTTTSHPRLGRRTLALIAALLASLLVSTAAPAQAAEGVVVTVAYGGSAKLVVSPWAQNYRDTSYDNGPCSSKVNVIMRASWSVDTVTTSSIHVNSVKIEFRTLWPMTLKATAMDSVWVRSTSTHYTASTSYRSVIINVNRTFSWGSDRRVATQQYYEFDPNGLAAICGVGQLRYLSFYMQQA